MHIAVNLDSFPKTFFQFRYVVAFALHSTKTKEKYTLVYIALVVLEVIHASKFAPPPVPSFLNKSQHSEDSPTQEGKKDVINNCLSFHPSVLPLSTQVRSILRMVYILPIQIPIELYFLCIVHYYTSTSSAIFGVLIYTYMYIYLIKHAPTPPLLLAQESIYCIVLIYIIWREP